MSRMWPLDAFRFDEGIDSSEVYVFDEDKAELEPMSRDDAIALARSRDQHLIAWWPAGAEDVPNCILGKVTLPLRWEEVRPLEPWKVDDRLWFDASCGGRDLLVEGQGHTFNGRMTAWCPHGGVGYSVSLDEMGVMSDEARYFVKGFLSGNEPGPPRDDEGNADPEDLTAWRHATSRFRRTGSWYGRWGTCQQCGRVLLPDSAADRCEGHGDTGQ